MKEREGVVEMATIIQAKDLQLFDIVSVRGTLYYAEPHITWNQNLKRKTVKVMLNAHPWSVDFELEEEVILAARNDRVAY